MWPKSRLLWLTAIANLSDRKPEGMAQLLETETELPPEVGKILAAALRGDRRLPFRLEWTANGRGAPSQNHTERDVDMAAAVHTAKKGGRLPNERAIREVAADRGKGVETVRDAYYKHKDAGRTLALARESVPDLPARDTSLLERALSLFALVAK